jgi:hypothetical protein
VAGVTRTLKYVTSGLWALWASCGVAAAQQRINTATGVLTYPSTLGTAQYLTGWTVARLNSARPCTTKMAGSTAYVLDALSPAYNVALVGGGAERVQAWCNSMAWVGQ